jgi:hypothetical protein
MWCIVALLLSWMWLSLLIQCAAENFVGIKLLFLYFNSVSIMSKSPIQ